MTISPSNFCQRAPSACSLYESTPINVPLQECIVWLSTISPMLSGGVEDKDQLNYLASNRPTLPDPRDRETSDKIQKIANDILTRKPIGDIKANISALLTDINSIQSPLNRSRSLSSSKSPTPIIASPYGFTPIRPILETPKKLNPK